MWRLCQHVYWIYIVVIAARQYDACYTVYIKRAKKKQEPSTEAIVVEAAFSVEAMVRGYHVLTRRCVVWTSTVGLMLPILLHPVW